MPAAGPRRGGGGARTPRCTRSGPRYGLVLDGFLRRWSWAACAALFWRVWARSLTRPVFCAVCLSKGGSAGAPQLFRMDADTFPFWLEDATLVSRACVRVRAPLGLVGCAGLACVFCCASPFLVALLGLLFLCPTPCGLGLPCLWLLLCVPSLRPQCLQLCVFSVPGCLSRPPPPLLSAPPPFVSCVSVFFLFFSRFIRLVFFPFLRCSAVLRRAVMCWLCSAGMVCVSWAVACVGACCCRHCAPAGAVWCLSCVVWCALVVHALCDVLFALRWCRADRPSLARLWYRAGAACGAVLVCCVLLSCCAVLAACCCVLAVDWRSCAVLSGAVLCWVLLCRCCCASLSCVVLVSAAFFCVVPCLSLVLRALSVCVVRCGGASRCLAWLCRGALLC